MWQVCHRVAACHPFEERHDLVAHKRDGRVNEVQLEPDETCQEQKTVPHRRVERHLEKVAVTGKPEAERQGHREKYRIGKKLPGDCLAHETHGIALRIDEEGPKPAVGRVRTGLNRA